MTKLDKKLDKSAKKEKAPPRFNSKVGLFLYKYHLLIYMVGRGGFEPPTRGLRVRCSTS